MLVSQVPTYTVTTVSFLYATAYHHSPSVCVCARVCQEPLCSCGKSDTPAIGVLSQYSWDWDTTHQTVKNPPSFLPTSSSLPSILSPLVLNLAFLFTADLDHLVLLSFCNLTYPFAWQSSTEWTCYVQRSFNNPSSLSYLLVTCCIL